jgi:vacuolar protein sorting-associated protein 13A/C
LHLTQVQYTLLLNLSQSIPLVLATPPELSAPVEPTKALSPPSLPENEETLVDLEPELRTIPSADGKRSWTTVDLLVTVNAVKLHMYDALATTESNLKEHGIARFALNHSTLRLKMLSDGAKEAQLVLKSFTMSNTRPGNSKFREIIPAAQHDRNQFMILYTMSGGSNSSALAILTVDSPQIIFALDPVFALLAFFTPPNQRHLPPEEPVPQNNLQDTRRPSSAVDFRIELHDVSVSVLENDTDPESPSIKLSISQILLSQQVLILQFGHYCQ